MFCKFCGKEIPDDSVICPSCCRQVAPLKAQAQSAPAQPRAVISPTPNAMILTGFVCAFLAPIVGLIYCILGLLQAQQYRENGQGLAKAGIVISSITLILTLTLTIIMIVNLSTLTALLNEYPYNQSPGYNPYY